jgi:undecaprenyl-diphosphatase
MVVAAISILAGASAAAAVGATRRSDPALSATRVLGEQLGRRRSLRGFLDSRVERGVATGLALTVGLLATIAAGIVIGVLAYMMRTQTGLIEADRFVEHWTDPRMTSTSVATLKVLTVLGTTAAVVLVGVATAAYALWRWRSRAIPMFLAIVIGGQLVLSNLIKGAVQRVRPDLRPLAGFSGPSFPSGHATAAAATFGAIAIVLGRDGTSRRRMMLAGMAVCIAVAVACSRVFLGVHWLTDVIGGLILGWSWVALCAVAFGGRVMRFAAPARAAAIQQESGATLSTPPGRGSRPMQREDIT